MAEQIAVLEDRLHHLRMARQIMAEMGQHDMVAIYERKERACALTLGQVLMVQINGGQN